MGYKNEHTLQDLLRQTYHHLEMDDVATEMEVRQMYARIVGDLISRLTRESHYKDGVLTVQLASAALRQELFNRRSSLADKINEALNKKAVKEIRFV